MANFILFAPRIGKGAPLRRLNVCASPPDKGRVPIFSRRKGPGAFQLRGRVSLGECASALRFILAAGSASAVPLCVDRGLGSSQTGDRHAEGRAGHVVQADVVAELDARRIAAVLPADADVQLAVVGAAIVDSHAHQLAHAGLIQLGEGIVLEDLGIVVRAEELACVVAGEAEGHLGQVVGAEAEEVCVLGDLVRGQAGARDLDHGADLILHRNASGGDFGVGGLDHHVLDVLELLDLANQRDHDLRHDLPVGMLLHGVDGGADHSLGLHRGDLRIGDGQAAAAVAHHRVELVQALDDGLDLADGLLLGLGQLLDLVLRGGHELVERRIQEADANRHALKRLVELLEVALLIGQDLVQRDLALGGGVGADHLAERGDAVGLKEHVLGAAQADALGAQLAGLLRVGGGVGVGADLQGAELVGPAHDGAEVAGDLRVHGLDQAVVDVAGGAVDGDAVALVVGLARQGELLVLLVHGDVAAAGDAALAHAAGNDGRVAGHAAAHGQDALSGLHAGDVLGRGLQANQNDLLAVGVPALGVLSGEHDLAAGSSGGGAQTAANGGGSLQGLGVELGMQQGVQVAGVDHQNGLFLGLVTFGNQIHSDLQGGGSGALAVAGLQHVQLALLNGELHVLHVVVVIFQNGADLHELLVGLGELLGHLRDGHGGAHAGDHVFALGIGQELAHHLLLAGGGVAGERNAGAAVIAQVAEGHGLYVDGRAPGVGDVVVAAIDVRAGVVPAAEHGLDGAHQLFLRVGGEVGADLLLVLGLELAGQLLEILSGELDVQLDALLFLHLVDENLEVLLADLHDDVGVHLDEAAIAIPGPAGIAGLLCQNLDDLLVQAQVQDGVHHAGHGGAGAGTHGNQQRILQIAELLAGDLFHLLNILHDLAGDLGVDLASILIILGAGLSGNGETLGHGQTDVGHLRKVRALAAQQVSHVRIAFAEEINVLMCHVDPPTKNSNWPNLG